MSTSLFQAGSILLLGGNRLKLLCLEDENGEWESFCTFDAADKLDIKLYVLKLLLLIKILLDCLGLAEFLGVVSSWSKAESLEERVNSSVKVSNKSNQFLLILVCFHFVSSNNESQGF